MKVWIDQDLCTGDGLCEEIAPDVFTLLDDGLAYVKEGDKVFSDPGGAEGLATIPDGQLEAVIESAEECPGECIYIEVPEYHPARPVIGPGVRTVRSSGAPPRRATRGFAPGARPAARLSGAGGRG